MLAADSLCAIGSNLTHEAAQNGVREFRYIVLLKSAAKSLDPDLSGTIYEHICHIGAREKSREWRKVGSQIKPFIDYHQGVKPEKSKSCAT